MTHTATEERLIDLEIRLTRQDDLVDTLNTQVYRQQKKIDELEALCTAMAARIREVAVTASQRTAVVDERPPHY
ncbi:SlyX family protein [Undibacterium sp. CY18W]|uniref:SlyX family protein n=1 Tax=Undibacterium hunanense TaxID=2762292 RepID=A0ABR6ZY53_9BURK|nr:SlyX family protein [Undibacterium hunanense]MBC3920756.1 SlyX family protein [Undibacterium hunanense]